MTSVGTMLEATQARICDARDAAIRFYGQAREARLRGDHRSWVWCMKSASAWRVMFARLISQ
jgi:hypothetical protein